MDWHGGIGFSFQGAFLDISMNNQMLKIFVVIFHSRIRDHLHGTRIVRKLKVEGPRNPENTGKVMSSRVTTQCQS